MDKQFSELINSLLDTEQVERYKEGVVQLKTVIPPKQSGTYRAFGSANLSLQNDLDEIRAGLQYMRSMKIIGHSRLEAKLRVEAKDSYGAKNAEERNSYCYQDSKYRDSKQELDNYTILVDRIYGLIWELKSQVELIS